ncbi:hypothetical protein [Mesorhizobium sp. B2-4-19]|uniref:DUF6894 family protein n=1 Tax=Mesorhizobium sp. B2-4-19 TaxID=2589930 RepID=UPI001FEFBEB0|nr:hypothetical protein [Mesorhizobium sp. B2-4-19]
MPRYYLDLYNGDGLTVDDDGQVFETRERLRREVIRILPDIVRDEIIENDHTSPSRYATKRRTKYSRRRLSSRQVGE